MVSDNKSTLYMYIIIWLLQNTAKSSIISGWAILMYEGPVFLPNGGSKNNKPLPLALDFMLLTDIFHVIQQVVSSLIIMEIHK